MNRHGFYYHPDYLLHDSGPTHPERPGRLQSVMGHLIKSVVWAHLEHVRPSSATPEQVQLVLSEKQMTAIWVLSIVVLPLAAIALGVAVWWRRRR